LAAEVGERSEPVRRMGRGKSEAARKSLNFEYRPCEVTSLNYQGIKYLTNTSEAKCKQTRQPIFTLKSAKENYKHS